MAASPVTRAQMGRIIGANRFIAFVFCSKIGGAATKRKDKKSPLILSTGVGTIKQKLKSSGRFLVRNSFNQSNIVEFMNDSDIFGRDDTSPNPIGNNVCAFDIKTPCIFFCSYPFGQIDGFAI